MEFVYKSNKCTKATAQRSHELLDEIGSLIGKDEESEAIVGIPVITTDSTQEVKVFPKSAPLLTFKNPLTVGLYLLYNIIMKTQERRPICAIRMKPDILQQGRVAAVTQKKTLGQWLEEAIAEKIERGQKLSKDG